MMKKNLLFAAAFLSAAIASHAQDTVSVDISVEITAPGNNAVIAYGDTAWVSFNYYNNGPDTLRAGDTLFFGTAAGVLYSKLLTDLEPGAGISMNDIIYLWNPADSAITGDICVAHVNQSEITYQNGTPALVTYIDDNPANDTNCISLTLQGPELAVSSIKLSTYRLDVFPNPATDFITLSSERKVMNSILSIITADGRIVLRKPLDAAGIEQPVYIGDLPAGLYQVVLQNDEDIARARLSITK